MASGKSKDGYDPDVMAELLVEKAGGMEAMAELVISGLKSDSPTQMARSMSMIMVFLKRQVSNRSGPRGMTDEELDRAMLFEMDKLLTVMPEDEFRGYIEKITKHRESNQTVFEEIERGEQRPKVGPAV